jgi:hypothetical protein
MSTSPRRLDLARASIAVAELMVVLDVAIVNVALPPIRCPTGLSRGAPEGGVR